MTSLRTRLVLSVALIAGLLIAAKTWLELERVAVPVATARGQRVQMALLETRPLLEATYAAKGTSGLRPVLARLTKVAEANDGVIVHRAGLIVAANGGGLEGRAVRETALGPAAALVGTSQGDHVRMSSRGTALYAAAPLRLELARPEASWVGAQPASIGPAFVLVRSDLTAALAAARAAVLRGNALLAGALLLPLIVLALGIELGLVRPARRILTAMERFDLSERDARTGLRGEDELARIGTAFDALAENLQLREAELVELNTRLDAVLESLPIGIMVVRREDGRALYVNSRWKELYGIPLDASRDILSLLSTVRCERPDGSPIPLEQLPIPIVLRSGSPATLHDMNVRRDDTLIPLVARAMPLNLWSAESFDAVLGTVQPPDPPPAVSEPVTVRWQPWVGMPPQPRARAAEPERVAAEPERVAAEPEPAAPEPEAVGLSFGPPMADPEAASAMEIPPVGEVPPAVLVVEGEQEVRDLAERALTAAGYRVIVTGSGEEALTFSRGEGRAIGAIVLDLWVQTPSGRMLVEELLEVDPAARVIGASGYRTDLPELAARGLMTAFLPKPYSSARLLTTVRKVLGRDLAEAAGPL